MGSTYDAVRWDDVPCPRKIKVSDTSGPVLEAQPIECVCGWVCGRSRQSKVLKRVYEQRCTVASRGEVFVTSCGPILATATWQRTGMDLRSIHPPPVGQHNILSASGAHHVRDVISPAAGSPDRDRITGSARSESRPDRGRLPFVAVGPPSRSAI
jgi:hypothetical protein